MAERSAPRAAFGLYDELPRSVVKKCDADVVVVEAIFELFGDFGEDLVGIKGGDRVAGNKIEQAEVAGFGALVLEEAGVFDGDAGFAGEDAEEVEGAFLVGAFGGRGEAE